MLNTLRRRLVVINLAVILLPLFTVVVIDARSDYVNTKAEKINQVGRIATFRHKELVVVLNGINARASGFLSNLYRSCTVGRTSLDAVCAMNQFELFVRNENALGGVLHVPGVIDNIIDGKPSTSNDWLPFKSGQLARFSPKYPDQERTFDVSVDDNQHGLRMLITLPLAQVQEIFVGDPDLGQSGETFLSDEDGFFVTRPKFESTMGHIHPISARPMQACLKQEDSEVLDTDYRNVPVIHGYRYVPEIGGGCIMAHYDQGEAFSPLYATLLRAGILMAIVGALGVLVSVAIARAIAAPIRQLTRATQKITAGDYDVRVDVTGTSEISILSDAFNQMVETTNRQRNEIAQAKQIDQRRNWMNEGISQLSAALTGDYSQQQIADTAIGVLGRYLEVGRGVLYLLQADGQSLELLGSYMYSENAGMRRSFKLGEGAVGQVALEKKPIFLTAIPSDEAPILTGTCNTNPLYTCTLPLIHDHDLLGVIGFGSFAPFNADQLEFLERALEVIASLMYVAGQRGQIRKLLTSAEEAERAVRLQNERLQDINARMEEQQQQLQQQSEELQQTNAQMEEQQQLLEQNNEELRRSQRDIDEKATQLELSNNYKSEFLANMSHELRTPLNAIILLSKMMSDNHDGNLGAKEIKRAEVIHRAGEDLLALINDVLDLSKVEAGRMELHYVSISSVNLCTEHQELFNPTASSKGLGFIVEDRIQGEFISDPDKIAQIIRNLLSNAFKFTRQGSVTLTIERRAAERLPLQITVRDSGIGIPGGKQATIFEAFRQGDGSISREYGGTGLGLTISLRFAELLGGSLTVHSAEGSGSEFILSLPETPPDYSAAAPTASVGKSQWQQEREPKPENARVTDDRNQLRSGQNIILLVDDDEDFAEALIGINQRLGYKTLVAHDGAAGLTLARQYRPSGILLDLGLPDMDGAEFLHQIKASHDLASIPVYVISARDRQWASGRSDIVGFLQKPVDSTQIAQAENQLIAAVTRAPEAGVLVVAKNESGSGEVHSLLHAKLDPTRCELRFTAHGSALLAALEEHAWGIVILDMGSLSIAQGLDAAKAVQSVWPYTALLFYGIEHLSDDDEARLRGYSDGIITKAPQAGQRLVDNVERFLHSVQLEQQRGSLQKFAPKASDPEVAQAGTRLAGRRILVIDDDLRNLFVITAALEQGGAQVLNAINGRRALEVLEKEPVDLVITDIMMPEMDGYQTISAMRAHPQYRHLPIIALTAKAMPEDRRNVLEVGADDFLSKPVDYDVLINMAALWCAKKGVGRD